MDERAYHTGQEVLLPEMDAQGRRKSNEGNGGRSGLNVWSAERPVRAESIAFLQIWRGSLASTHRPPFFLPPHSRATSLAVRACHPRNPNSLADSSSR
ncbi:uncharacterized protein FOMMEDRAFT_154206 [Fomitiporia mediterranea MF3/22]|uniref:uncharacterized protein n=1 Tax=Fomitiporia mediterranea (strain MF3/22) TaxID=694068 RepID=UPI0004409B93|nr:uncharacterized protein FOMMEDRAFT_154206 [Fomitiporia mediterranea MF3/22]EJD05040.1 hypothetical protein FOMMEDRAFT_154206 [Fomitiporia mediterranea MF3/22]